MGGENIKRTPPLPRNRVTSREQPRDRGRGKRKENNRALKIEGGGNRKRTTARQRGGQHKEDSHKTGGRGEDKENSCKTEGGGNKEDSHKTERGAT